MRTILLSLSHFSFFSLYPSQGLQGAIDGIIPTTSREYKIVSCTSTKAREAAGGSSNVEQTYYGLNNHSITSGSSNHTELLRAYDYGKLHGMHRVETHHHHQQYFASNTDLLDEDEYTIKSNLSVMSETDPPTDPGIRQFTKSPPRPNERRIGGCFTPGATRGGVHRTPHPGEQPLSNFSLQDTEDDEDEDEEEQEEDAQEERDEEDSNEDDTEGKDSERAHRSGSSDNGEEGDTCSSTSDTGGEEISSRNSMTPTNEEDEESGRVRVSSPINNSIFGAIPRDRSRRPSWTYNQGPTVTAAGISSRNQRFKVANKSSSSGETTLGAGSELKSISHRGAEREDEEDGAEIMEEEREGDGSDSSESLPVIVTSRDQDTKVRKNGGRKFLSSLSSSHSNPPFFPKQILSSNNGKNVTIKSGTKMGKSTSCTNQQQRTNKSPSSSSSSFAPQQQQQQTSSSQTSYHGMTSFLTIPLPPFHS